MKGNVASLYIHIPFCKQRCAYCDFFSTVPRDESVYAPYTQALLKDIEFFKSLYALDSFCTVYIGGGTPSLLPLPLIKELCSYLHSTQSLPIEEFTIEANPQDITADRLHHWQDCGINRLSLGIQSLNDEVLQKEGRRGGRVESLRVLEQAKREWKGILSLDFIAGLKGQEASSLLSDLHLALQFEPSHVSLYELIPHGNDADDYEARERREKLWECAASLLEKEGYIQYEVSNFSQRGKFECMHNKAYWKMMDYVGVGAAAVGTMQLREKIPKNRLWALELKVGQEMRALRSTGVQDVSTYIAQEKRQYAYEWEEVSANELLKDALLMGFRLREGVDDSDFKARFASSLISLLPKTITKWQEAGLLSVEEREDNSGVPLQTSHLKLTKKGLMLLNSFLCDAFAELDE